MSLYGRWYQPGPAGVIDDVPLHNSSYKRALLLDFGDDLETIFDRESGLHETLRSRGLQLYIEPAAKTYHVNVSQPVAAMSLRFHAGRAFGSTRARQEHWSWFRRLLYIGGAPLIPLLELRRIRREIRAKRPDLAPRIIPSLFLLLLAAAAGEVAGYALGAGDVGQRLEDFEVDRARQLTASDRKAIGL